MARDIKDRKDIELLVNEFYKKVRANKILGPIFDDIAKLDWENHLPIMYSFWSSMLLGEQSYTRNPMTKHIQLSKIATLGETEFSEWLALFHQTTDELYSGPIASEAKQRAANIARLMLYKIQTA